MPVDPTDPDTFDEEETPEEVQDVEAPEADAAEQQAELLPRHDDPLPEHAPDTANPADAAEQARVVEVEDDEYR
ncbi:MULTISPECIES: hypothetical protein [Streptomyces]|uniref:Uncharacterized protein n=1 Tax=Streptomyces lycii TaxID=2654337 RepID=A0ABQ7FQN3_9ACTN|nr:MULTISPECIES: hypothetical protein [Streptomyces]KAF4409627.1 hypothetical protein GCU69_08020 [Streptomyces lycii]PGH52376.1 hypothetical protein CRI70_01680 [Streptomyces sp. Ru87]